MTLTIRLSAILGEILRGFWYDWNMKVRCPGCHRVFKNNQGLGNHLRFCKQMKEQQRPAALAPQPTRSTPPESRAAPMWDVNWPEGRKRDTLLSELPVDWGIRRQGGRWVPVVMLNSGLSYSQAVVAADRFNVLDRISPRRPRHPTIQEPDAEDKLALLLLAMLLHQKLR